MTLQTSIYFMKKPPEDSFLSNPWHGLDRGVSPHRIMTDPGPKEWSGEVPHVTLIIEFSEKVATLMAHEDVPEDMMYYLLDCMQQSGMEGVRATRAELRKINIWIKQKLMMMEAEGMLWRENNKWVFEG